VSPLKKAKVKSLIAYCEAKVQPNGRLLIRKSGTEPMIRIMLEGSDMALLQELADELVKNMI
jgi:phosphoglucosamine mutase